MTTAHPEIPNMTGALDPSSGFATARVTLSRLPATVYLGLLTFLALLIVGVFQAILAPHDPSEVVGAVLAGPSRGHPLGLDYAGRDTASNLIYGARPSLVIGVAAALISAVIGGVIGIAGGYMGGIVDRLTTLVTDFFLVIPVLPLMIVLAALYGAKQSTLILIIGLLSWMPTARVLSAQVRSLRERMFVLRAESLGLPRTYIMSRHILPHVAPLLVATTSLVVGSAIFAESALDFLGLGDPQSRSWGNQIAQAFQAGAVRNHAWPVILGPGLAIAAIVLSVNLIGRGIEATLNPRLRVRHVRAGESRLRLLRRAMGDTKHA
jgi:peptide/nickel transport system permease protein